MDGISRFFVFALEAGKGYPTSRLSTDPIANNEDGDGAPKAMLLNKESIIFRTDTNHLRMETEDCISVGER